MPLSQATKEGYNDPTMYAGTKLTSPDIYAAANRTPIPGTISPGSVSLSPLLTGNAKAAANTGIVLLNRGLDLAVGDVGTSLKLPLFAMTLEEGAAADATAVMALPFGFAAKGGCPYVLRQALGADLGW